MGTNTGCAVYGCRNTIEKSGKLPVFFKMPTSILRLRKWIEACGRLDLDNLLKVKDVYYFQNNFVVCSDHFEEHCFQLERPYSLFPDAVPTLKLPKDGAGSSYRSSLIAVLSATVIDILNFISSPESKIGSNIKLETVCNICLSTDRKLHTMTNMVITQEWRDIGLNTKYGVLCWECKAVINKVTVFKTKALLAQQVLKGRIMGSNVDCLTSLATTINKKVIVFREQTNPIGCDENNDVGIKIGDEIKEEIADEDDICDRQEFEIDIVDNFVGLKNNTDFVAYIKEEPGNDYEIPVEGIEENDNFIDSDISNNDINKIIHKKAKKIRNVVSTLNEKEVINKGERKLTDNYINSDISSKTVEKKANKIKNNQKDVEIQNSYVVCTLNEEDFINHREKQRTMMRFSVGKWNCASCILTFRNETKFNDHMRQFHSEESGSFVCHICACRFLDQKELKSHTDNHFTLYKCALCKHARYYSRLISMKSHIRVNHGNDYVCKICKSGFNSRISLMYHYKTHNTKECHVCGKTVICLKSHMESHDTSPQECNICHKQLKSRKSLWSHMLTHTNTNKDEAYCAECDMHFKNKYLYHIHLKYTVSHVKADKECDYCHKKFTRKFTLAKHISLVHFNKSEYRCPTCNKLFKSRGSVNRHVKYVHNKMAMIKKYECIVCERKFTIKRLLNNHMNSHTGNRPYKCDMCESAFGQSGALYKHKQLVHKIVKSKT